MTQTTKYVGLDVHQATTVAAVHEESGHMIARSIVPTDAPALLEFFREMRGAIHVTFEEGTLAQWLHDLLVPVVDRVFVCNRRGQTQQGNKGIAPMPRSWRICSATARCALSNTTAGRVRP